MVIVVVTVEVIGRECGGDCGGTGDDSDSWRL